jgi:hypothetical protein
MVCRAEKDRQFAFAVVNMGLFGVFSIQGESCLPNVQSKHRKEVRENGESSAYEKLLAEFEELTVYL